LSESQYGELKSVIEEYKHYFLRQKFEIYEL